MNFFSIILSQIMSEKTQSMESLQEEITKYTFKVSQSCNKVQIKEAFKKRYGQVPNSVNIINVKNRKNKFKNKFSSFYSYKKAIVTFRGKVKFALDEKKQ